MVLLMSLQSTLICLGLLALSQSNGANAEDVQLPPRVDWDAEGQKTLTALLQRRLNQNSAKNVIVFVGDGMGVSTVSAARAYQVQRGLTDPRMAFEKFPDVALSKTSSVDFSVSDSAATATAMFSGVKTKQDTLGVNQNVVKGSCQSSKGNEVKSILHWSQEKGKAVGVVTTARVTHATPAATYASSADRDWEAYVTDNKGDCKDIAYQLVKNNTDIQVILGGGRIYFIPDNETDVEYPTVKGKRKDGVNLIQEWMSDKQKHNRNHRYVWNLTQFQNVDPVKTDYLFGLFQPGHMQYEIDRQNDTGKEPSLTEMVAKSINILKRNKNGFFLMVESGRIDHAHHDSNAKRAIYDTIALSDAVAKAVTMTNEEDTLIVATADHSHTFTMGGYPTWKAPVLGVTDRGLGLDDKTYTILAYANGPGHNMNGSRHNVTNEVASQDNYIQQSAVPLKSETHGGEDVAIYARGPMSHLFQGSQEQSFIAHAMAYTSCVGNKKNRCDDIRTSTSNQLLSYSLYYLVSIFVALFNYLV